MKTYHLKHMNAFTNEPFSGNPAGVVLDAKGLSEENMQAIARDMSLPETAFVLPPTTKSADIQIRWFTPAVEVPLCGHATIATFQALAEEGLHGMKHAGKYKFRLQTKSGILGINVEKSYSGIVTEFQLPIPRFHIKKVPTSLLKALGLHPADIEPRLPFVSYLDLYLPVKKFSKLKSLQPDLAKLIAVNKATRSRGVCVLCLETIEQSSAVHSRFFGPAVGINEDPVTGSANGPLGVYLYQYAIPAEYPIPSLLLPDGRIEFVGEQGDVIGRRGRVKIRLRVHGRTVKDVAIAGDAVTLMDSTLKC